MRSFTASLLVCSAAGAARAGVVAYDTITNYSATPFQIFTASPVQADDTSLDPAAGLTISRVSLLARLRSGAAAAQFDGTLTLRLYADGVSHTPGTLLHEATRDVLLDRGVDRVISFDIPSVVAPSPDIWTAWYFADGAVLTVYNDVWVRQSTAGPSPGSTSPGMLAGHPTDPPSQWQLSTYEDRNYAIRIETIPAPGAALAGVFAVAALRRRRA